ncbi:hypothetical protein PCLA_09f0203 [Pseudomonas citronellolis]|nr:hypothetical protein PCLA_09f0203 [Pseudomonas citronellolis]
MLASVRKSSERRVRLGEFGRQCSMSLFRWIRHAGNRRVPVPTLNFRYPGHKDHR